MATKSTVKATSTTKSATTKNAEKETTRVLSEASTKNSITVYRKRSTFKGATENDFWYSGTRADGHSVILKFKCELPDEFKNSSAFIVSNIIGNFKKEEVVVKNQTYTNFTYYINECDFEEIEGEPLPL